MKVGDRVAFSGSVVRRTMDRLTADARGVVVLTYSGSPIVGVDFEGSWIDHEDGGTVRHVPVANLRRVVNGVVFRD